MVKKWYNDFLLGGELLSNNTVVEPLANFCKVNKSKPKTNWKAIQNSKRLAAEKKLADDLNALLTSSNMSSFTRHKCENGYCYYCDANGNCYYCLMKDDKPYSCVYYTRDEIDRNNYKGIGTYIIDTISPNNLFKARTIGNNIQTGLITEGLTNIQSNTGETERYVNIINLYNEMFIHNINMGIGIICLVIFIYNK
jgi:hypothetical protein